MKSDVVKRVARALLGRTLYRVGHVATIRFGPARGLRYRIFADYGLGPVFGPWEPGAEQVLAQFHPALLIDLHTPWEDIAVGEVLSWHGYTAVRSETRAPIPRLDRGWPAPDGVWGQIIARQG